MIHLELRGYLPARGIWTWRSHASARWTRVARVEQPPSIWHSPHWGSGASWRATFADIPGPPSSARLFDPERGDWSIIRGDGLWTDGLTLAIVTLAQWPIPPYFDPSGLGIRDNRFTPSEAPKPLGSQGPPLPFRPGRDS